MGSAVEPSAIDEPRTGTQVGGRAVESTAAAVEEAAVEEEGSISIASSSSLWLVVVDSTPALAVSSFSSWMAAGIMDDEESANRCILCTMAMACISCYTDAPTPTQKTHTHTHREKEERERERDGPGNYSDGALCKLCIHLLYYIFDIAREQTIPFCQGPSMTSAGH